MWCTTRGFPFWSAPSINKSLASSISVFCISFNIETRPQVVSIDSWYMGSSNGVFLCATGKGENFRAMTFLFGFVKIGTKNSTFICKDKCVFFGLSFLIALVEESDDSTIQS